MSLAAFKSLERYSALLVIGSLVPTRQQYDATRIMGMMAKMRRGEPLAPVIVSACGDGYYDIVDGNHRCEAARRCGVARVPAVVVSA
jgi:ParB-like chromosome segregation protein Spo0J